ncbi:unnamed protein product [Cylindrotheca closterium]|uniref:Phosducin thioredoxin-like domain-containing protein n=1 Tax=Cylindrotheca closterium TaxID=2856 RepID=A0AAD2G1J2_9STRA|nr:unnamed protein product [Cylindrotheca closterium]
MPYVESSNEAKPQSIVNHIGRLGAKIVKPISNHRKRMRMQRKLPERSLTSSQKNAVAVSEDGSCNSDEISFFGDDHENELGQVDMEGIFETMDQNEFLIECFVTNGQSDVVFLVNFFNQETSISNAIEDVLSKRVLETKSKCKCRRINSKRAPLFTAKLQIDPEQPTIVAIKNGKVLSKVSDISSSECTEVENWLARTRILQSVAPRETFSGLI